jgi:hypothetical protein
MTSPDEWIRHITQAAGTLPDLRADAMQSINDATLILKSVIKRASAGSAKTELLLMAIVTLEGLIVARAALTRTGNTAMARQVDDRAYDLMIAYLSLVGIGEIGMDQMSGLCKHMEQMGAADLGGFGVMMAPILKDSMARMA